MRSSCLCACLCVWQGLWDLYPLRARPWVVPVCVLATLAFLLLAMFSCIQSARPELWYLLSGTV